ncbi:MAG TPA: glycogen synthase [Saprospiraceae bacterium]|nr:glycogen synthase [Saprospiraceae bacterium]HMQ81867.1 glycogen synthase [Saprospiraceae bacterium]
MQVLHISAECYPAAKAGGLGDVVGALPKYLKKAGADTAVIIPKYSLKWINNHRFQPIYKGAVRMHNYYIPFVIEQESENSLGFPFFVVNIPGKFDRPGIYADPSGYGYGDEVERYLSFQQAVLQWLVHSPGKPDILHCHDHHTGLIPFMVKHCPEYQSLRHLATVFTIHNGTYHGAFSWRNMYLLPWFDSAARGLLDWADTINPLASGIKCAWRVTTVSPSYLSELKVQSNGMEWLLQHESHKSLGIINGIDTQVWNPSSDTFIASQLEADVATFKLQNKRILGQRFNLDMRLPLIVFIGRLVGEKGADLIPELVGRVLHSGIQVAFAVLGTGDPNLQDAFRHLSHHFYGRFDAALEYNEALAHQLYAGADFIFMPSRVEPCGLNQMYAMTYGTIPIVRSIGGLKDTVPDIGEPDGSGRGIRFNHFDLDDAHLAVYRATELYQNQSLFDKVRHQIMQIDFSWEQSAERYLQVYKELIFEN